MRPLIGLATALLLAPICVAAQTPPSPEDILGYGIGERFTDVGGVNRYMQALAQASPLVSLHEYGRTNEGRPLIQVLVASVNSRAHLEEVWSLNGELTDPETSEARAREIISANPGVVYFSYGVHGNESSSSEAAMWTAWDLARGAEAVRGVLDSLVVVLDPVVNPDGRDRYVSFYRGARGAVPNPDPQSREHHEPWPGGRTNHYYFDLNRDWSWMSQVETRARLATWDQYNPQVHVDFHEMSPGSTYFFFPASKPINPIYPDHILEWGRRFGEGNAAAFDERGWLYYTEEGFDMFYPGYGDSWPSLLSAIGMTYEQAGHGRGGLAYERPDGTILTLADRVQHHRTAGNATLRTAANGRADLLSGFAATFRSMGEGLDDILLVPADNSGAARALVRYLMDQGIQVERAANPFRAEARAHTGLATREDFPAGTFRVRSRQRRGRLAIALLEPESVLDGTFSYDITAWSLPYAYGVEAHATGDDPEGGWQPVTPDNLSEADGESTGAAYGYLLRPGFEVAPALVNFLKDGGRAYVLADTFSIDGRDFPRGTVLLPRARNEGLDELVSGAGLAASVIAVSGGLTPRGPDLGTDNSAVLELPDVAVLAGEGTSSGSFGAHWFFLEQRLGLPFDAINVGSVAGSDLDEYEVIVIPEGFGLEGILGEGGVETLSSWVHGGGTLLAVGSAARWVAGDFGGVELREDEDEEGEDEDEADEEDRLERALRTREAREEEEWRESTPGNVLEVTLDPRHPLAYGAGAMNSNSRMFVLSRGVGFEPDEDFESPAFFARGLQRTSGIMSDGNLERLRQSSWLVQKRVGAGKVILFADDPLFRMFWYSGFQLYTNALLLAPAF